MTFLLKCLHLLYVPLTHPQKIGGLVSFQGPVSGDLLTWTWQTLDFHLCQNQKSLYREWSSQNRESLYYGYTNLTIGYIAYKTPSGLMSLSPILKLWEFRPPDGITCETGRHVYHSHSWLENDTIKWWHFTREKTGISMFNGTVKNIGRWCYPVVTLKKKQSCFGSATLRSNQRTERRHGIKRS